MAGDSAKGLYVEFSLEAREDVAKSLQEGRPQFRDVEYVRIVVPGDATNIPHRQVTDDDRARFATVYDAWKRGQKDVHDGQPLKKWPEVKPSEVSMLAHSNVHTVEQLALLSDENCTRIGPVRVLRDKARAYMEESKAAAPVAQMRSELEEMRKANAALQEQVKETMLALKKASDGGKQNQKGG